MSESERAYLRSSVASNENGTDITAPNGKGPNLRGSLGVDIAAEKLKSQGFTVLGREVDAWIPGTPLGRRYDLVVQNSETQVVFGVEVKTTTRLSLQGRNTVRKMESYDKAGGNRGI